MLILLTLLSRCFGNIVYRILSRLEHNRSQAYLLDSGLLLKQYKLQNGFQKIIKLTEGILRHNLA